MQTLLLQPVAPCWDSNGGLTGLVGWVIFRLKLVAGGRGGRSGSDLPNLDSTQPILRTRFEVVIGFLLPLFQIVDA